MEQKPERFFIDYYNFDYTTSTNTRDTLEGLIFFIRKMHEQHHYGFRIIYRSKKLMDEIVTFNSNFTEVEQLITKWYNTIINYPFYYTLIDKFVYFDEDSRIAGSLHYWNIDEETVFNLKKYQASNFSKTYEKSNIFPQTLWNEGKFCFYELKRYLDLALIPSEENIMKSKFEMMNPESKVNFDKVLKATEKVINKMETIVKEIRKKRETWRFIRDKESPLTDLKELYTLMYNYKNKI